VSVCVCYKPLQNFFVNLNGQISSSVLLHHDTC
jgi:hypothetical protein